MIKELLSKKFIRFSFGGIINYSLKLFLTFILTEILNFWYLYSYSISLIVATGFGYFYNVYITFEATVDKESFVKYTVVLISFMIADVFFVKVFTDNLHFHYLLSIVIVTTIVFFIKYNVYDRLVFYKNSEVE